MFARIMGIVSPCVFVASSIAWGLSTGHPLAAILAFAVGVGSAFLSFRAWRRVGGNVNPSSVSLCETAAAVRAAWKRYWKSALIIAALYCLNLVLTLALKGAYSVRAWDVLMLWFIVDGMVLSSWVELLRKCASDLAGEGEA